MNGTIDLYGEQQQGDFTLDQIAEEAGVSAATIANHYGSKYEVLKAAYERLLSPLVDTIVEADRAGVYQPKDAIQELVRYVYGVASISQEHRSLTTGMVKAYFEIGPSERDFSFEEGADRVLVNRPPLGEYVGNGLAAIFRLDTFRGPIFSPQNTRVDWWMLDNVADNLLLGLYRTTDPDIAELLTYRACRTLIGLGLHEDNPEDLRERIKRVSKLS